MVEAYLIDRDVLMISPKGSGKSLTFHIMPFAIGFFKHGERDDIQTVCLVILRGQRVFQPGIFSFLMKESKKRRQKQPGKLLAKCRSQPVNLPGARPLMNPLFISNLKVFLFHIHLPSVTRPFARKANNIF